MVGFLPFCSEFGQICLDSYHSAWIRSECVGEGKVLPTTHIRQNLYPTVRVRVSWGWGTGSPGKPQGYLCHSLEGVNILKGQLGAEWLEWGHMAAENIGEH